MDSVKDILGEELKYLLGLIKHYQENIKKLPRGSISKKKIFGREYIYSQHRQGKKVLCNYLGKLSAGELKKLQEKINQREQYKKLLKEVNQKILYLRKALNVRIRQAS